MMVPGRSGNSPCKLVLDELEVETEGVTVVLVDITMVVAVLKLHV